MNNAIQLKVWSVFVSLILVNAVTAKVNPQPGENLWRLTARIGFCVDAIGTKLDWVESNNDRICSKLENLDAELASHNDTVCSKLEGIDSIVDDIESGVDGICSKVEKIDDGLSVHDASICSKLEQLETKQDLLLSKIDLLEFSGPCETLVFQSDIPFTIDTPGVYCLAESVSFSNGTAITIASDNVILDLQDKKIDGATGGDVGIAINSGLQNITIQNGVLCNMNNKGIDADATNNIAFVSMSVMDSLIDSVVDMPATIAPITCLQIKDVKVLNVGMFKEFPIISVVDSVVDSIIDVPDCVLSPMTGININCANEVMLMNCQALCCLGDGFALQQAENVTATACNAEKNGGNGFVLSNTDTSCLKWCKANMNCFHGVCDSACNGDNLYLGCIAKQNGIHGFNIAGGGKVVQECVASQNTRDGFNLSTSFLVDGALDTTFGNGGIVVPIFQDDLEGRGVVVQKDGKIVVAGAQVNGAANFAVARFNTDGSLDTTFGAGGLVLTNFSGDSEGRAIALQENGKIVVAGTTEGEVFDDFAVARYNTDGNLDITFNSTGTVTTSFGVNVQANNTVAVQKDGKIVVAGGTTGLSFTLARYNIDGSLDTTFGDAGKVITSFGDLSVGNGVVIQKDGKIVVVGISDLQGSNDFALVRYNSDGSLDVTFGDDGKVITDFGSNSSDAGNAVALQKDGKIVVAGVSNAQGSNDFALARYNTDGSLDVAFGTDGKVTTDFGGNSTDQGRAVAIQKDGKIVVAGTSNAQGSPDFALARYNTDGSLDVTFGDNNNGRVITDITGVDDGNAIALQKDGKIVLAGSANAGSNLSLTRYVVFKRGVVVRDCIAEENGEDGFNIAGQAYDVRDSAAIHNVSDGFLLASLTDACQLLSNEALQNNNIGIENLGINNQFFNNRSHDNTINNYTNVPLVTIPIVTTSFWANVEG